MLQEIVLSGIRPSTGGLHLGNIQGAVENMVNLQNSGQYQCYFFLADLHAGTTDPNFKEIRENTYGVLADMIACGLDSEKSVIFRQSDIPELAQLHLFFSYVTTVSELQRNPVYREQVKELGLNGNGLSSFLNYPVLQAADICLYRGELIPVGKDQIPHIELTREIARRFNELCGKEILPIPEPLLTETPRIPGIDGRKMSKSYGNDISLSHSEEETEQRISQMITDTKRPRLTDPGYPDNCPVFALHECYSSPEEVERIKAECQQARIGCRDSCKPALAQVINSALRTPREKRQELFDQPEELEELLLEEAVKARKVAIETIKEVRVGLNLSRIS